MSDKDARGLAEREKALIEVFTVAANTAEQSLDLIRSFEECLGPDWERESASANISGSFTYPKWWVFDYAVGFYFHSPSWEAKKVISHYLFISVCIDGRTYGGKRVERPVALAGRISWNRPKRENEYALLRDDTLSAWTRTSPSRAMDGTIRDVQGFSHNKNKGPDFAKVLGVPLLEIAGPDDVRTKLYQPLEPLIAEAAQGRKEGLEE